MERKKITLKFDLEQVANDLLTKCNLISTSIRDEALSDIKAQVLEPDSPETRSIINRAVTEAFGTVKAACQRYLKTGRTVDDNTLERMVKELIFAKKTVRVQATDNMGCLIYDVALDGDTPVRCYKEDEKYYNLETGDLYYDAENPTKDAVLAPDEFDGLDGYYYLKTNVAPYYPIIEVSGNYVSILDNDSSDVDGDGNDDSYMLLYNPATNTIEYGDLSLRGSVIAAAIEALATYGKTVQDSGIDQGEAEFTPDRLKGFVSMQAPQPTEVTASIEPVMVNETITTDDVDRIIYETVVLDLFIPNFNTSVTDALKSSIHRYIVDYTMGEFLRDQLADKAGEYTTLAETKDYPAIITHLNARDRFNMRKPAWI